MQQAKTKCRFQKSMICKGFSGSGREPQWAFCGLAACGGGSVHHDTAQPGIAGQEPRNKTGTDAIELLYVWIAPSKPAWRRRRAYRVVSKGLRRQRRSSGKRLASGRTVIRTVISRVESGDGRKRKQGDFGRKPRQGPG